MAAAMDKATRGDGDLVGVDRPSAGDGLNRPPFSASPASTWRTAATWVGHRKGVSDLLCK
jgi:hypothetical protein